MTDLWPFVYLFLSDECSYFLRSIFYYYLLSYISLIRRDIAAIINTSQCALPIPSKLMLSARGILILELELWRHCRRWYTDLWWDSKLVRWIQGLPYLNPTICLKIKSAKQGEKVDILKAKNRDLFKGFVALGGKFK